jgi:hypothetical protein
LYAVIDIYLDELFTPIKVPGFTSRGIVMMTKGRESRRLTAFRKCWAVPKELPIFAETLLPISESGMMFTIASHALQWPDFYIGYEIRAPGFVATKFVRVIQRPTGTLWIPDVP